MCAVERGFKSDILQLKQSGCEARVQRGVQSTPFYLVERGLEFWLEQSSWGSNPGFAAMTLLWWVQFLVLATR